MELRLTRISRFSKENFPNINKLVDVLADVGKRHNATPSQITLAWLLAQGDNVIPIPGTTNIEVSQHIGTNRVRGTSANISYMFIAPPRECRVPPSQPLHG